eukprot:Rhum_TRINITY_DN6752_c0_g1::Rhum_TRINITY_DN6752_c0_g1_i1::g.20824::m.20824
MQCRPAGGRYTAETTSPSAAPAPVCCRRRVRKLSRIWLGACSSSASSSGVSACRSFSVFVISSSVGIATVVCPTCMVFAQSSQTIMLQHVSMQYFVNSFLCIVQPHFFWFAVLSSLTGHCTRCVTVGALCRSTGRSSQVVGRRRFMISPSRSLRRLKYGQASFDCSCSLASASPSVPAPSPAGCVQTDRADTLPVGAPEGRCRSDADRLLGRGACESDSAAVVVPIVVRVPAAVAVVPAVVAAAAAVVADCADSAAAAVSSSLCSCDSVSRSDDVDACTCRLYAASSVHTDDAVDGRSFAAAAAAAASVAPDSSRLT